MRKTIITFVLLCAALTGYVQAEHGTRIHELTSMEVERYANKEMRKKINMVKKEIGENPLFGPAIFPV